MGDRTYCDNTSCPFKDCDRHFSNIKVSTLVSVANFGADCRRYIGYVVHELQKNNYKDAWCGARKTKLNTAHLRLLPICIQPLSRSTKGSL